VVCERLPLLNESRDPAATDRQANPHRGEVEERNKHGNIGLEPKRMRHFTRGFTIRESPTSCEQKPPVASRAQTDAPLRRFLKSGYWDTALSAREEEK
jgi:hypothetical protein